MPKPQHDSPIDLNNATITNTYICHHESETTMKTIDLSIRHIGRTVRIERKNIVGTHNYIEGLLEHFDFSTESLHSLGADLQRTDATNITATIAGHTIDLTGTEPLTVIEENK